MKRGRSKAAATIALIDSAIAYVSALPVSPGKHGNARPGGAT